MSNIFEVVTQDGAPYGALVDAVVFAGLTEAVKDDSLMVFAPTESVFDNTPDHYKWNKEFTSELLLNHVTNKKALTGDAQTFDTAGKKTLKATDVKITENNEESADITIKKDNTTAYVYNVEGFVVPKTQANVATVNKNLLEAAVDRLTKADLVDAVSDGLKTTLQNLRTVTDSPNFDADYGFTVFLPTEKAFLELRDAVKDKKGFTEFLASGGVDHTLKAHTRVGGQRVESGTYTSANTQTSYTDIVVDLAATDKTVKIAGVEAKIQNVEPVIYKNGAVHEIDEVLYFPRNTTVEVAKVAAQTLSSLLTATKLDEALNGLEKSTVFAPTDAALEPVTCYNAWLPVGDENLKKLLQHHVLADRVYSGTVNDVASGKVAESLIKEAILKEELDLDTNQLDVLATNGNIHVINKVLIPPTLKKALPTGTIVDVALTATKKLAEFVVLADLVGALSSCPTEGKAYTVFAPKDTAFDALTSADVEYLTANDNEMLKKVLLHHVVSAPAFAADLNAQQKFATLNGDEVEVTKSETGAVSVGGAGASVESADNKAFNGVIHIIDQVLIPEGVVLPSTQPGSASMTTVSLISSALVGAASYFLAAF